MPKKKIVLKGTKFYLELMKDCRYISYLLEWANDPEVIADLTENSVPNTKEKWEKTIGNASENNQGFAIISTANGIIRPIGYTYFYPIDRSRKEATSGLIIGKKSYWRKKYGMEVVQVMLDYGFNELKMEIIIGKINVKNIKSMKLHERLGYQLWDKDPNNPKQMIYAITKKTWKKKRLEILKILAARTI